jgi:hypothetical protein
MMAYTSSLKAPIGVWLSLAVTRPPRATVTEMEMEIEMDVGMVTIMGMGLQVDQVDLQPKNFSLWMLLLDFGTLQNLMQCFVNLPTKLVSLLSLICFILITTLITLVLLTL